jgi:hypothetical protein
MLFSIIEVFVPIPEQTEGFANLFSHGEFSSAFLILHNTNLIYVKTTDQPILQSTRPGYSVQQVKERRHYQELLLDAAQ